MNFKALLVQTRQGQNQGDNNKITSSGCIGTTADGHVSFSSIVQK